MIPYAGARHGSGVLGYEAGPDWIVVHFRNGRRYHYDARHPGAQQVLTMQQLAAAGSGLATYISRHVGADFAARIRPPGAAG